MPGQMGDPKDLGATSASQPLVNNIRYVRQLALVELEQVAQSSGVLSR